MSGVDDGNAMILAVMRAKGGLRACEACGNDNWAVVTVEGHHFGAHLYAENGSVVMPPPHIPAVVLGCNTCGNMRFHAKVFIDALLAT